MRTNLPTHEAIQSNLINPIQTLVDTAINYIQEMDPTWEQVQPQHFRHRVVEGWKQTISTELWHDKVIWKLPMGPNVFFTSAELFSLYSFRYNPYS